MAKDSQMQFCLYKIYSENCLLYIGHTIQPLKNKLRAHFFKESGERGICIECVTRIEYAFLPTKADLYIMSMYYINRLKPALNYNWKSKDRVTITLPELSFQEYSDACIEDWRQQIRMKNAHDEEKCKLRFQLEKERQEKQCEVFSSLLLTDEDKQRLYKEWLKNVYEPVRNGLL